MNLFSDRIEILGEGTAPFWDFLPLKEEGIESFGLGEPEEGYRFNCWTGIEPVRRSTAFITVFL